MEPLNGFDLYRCSHSKFRGIFNGFCALVLFLFLFQQDSGLPSAFLSQLSVLPRPNCSLGGGLNGEIKRVDVIRRKVVEISNNTSNYTLYDLPEGNLVAIRGTNLCSGLYEHKGYKSQCDFLLANPQCTSDGIFDYISFFYCNCAKYKVLGYLVLGLWLAALFYLLGNTAADYFCCCLEKLSKLLRLSPTVAGVTLLPFGNGAPDVFASIAAFVGSDAGEVGLNSVLGGAVFVTCVVAGIVSISVANLSVQINKKCFIRDVCFFLLALVALVVILIVGEVSLWGAIAFVSFYVLYALSIAANEVFRKNAQKLKLESVKTLLPVASSMFSSPNNEDETLYDSLLKMDLQDGYRDGVPHLEDKVPYWMWAANVAIYANESVKTGTEDGPKLLWGWKDEETEHRRSCFSCAKICALLELPLSLPRRLTIPIIEEERWSKAYAVASASLSPILLAFLWSTQDNEGIVSGKITYLVGTIVGGTLGILALVFTTADQPPKRFLFPWLFGGFFMSIIWFYIVANELISLLVALGTIFGIKPSLLGLTVLAWGNSMGDLMSNVALAMSGGDGVQIAMSGCYAGPMFNTLIGLGISMLLGALSKRPASYIVPRDPSLYFTLGFLILALAWSLFVLPRSDMRPNKFFGVGLMIIYIIFLFCRITFAMGTGLLDGIS